MTLRRRLARWLFETVSGQSLAALTPDLRDGRHWTDLTGRPHDRSRHEIREQYTDALHAWRKNPIAWRIISITTDYTVGDAITLTSAHADMQRFITAFWDHPQNRITLRQEAIAEELARAGDLFVLLFRQRHDGVSLLRFLTKDQVHQIETKTNDWERETIIWQKPAAAGEQPKKWVTPHHPRARRYKANALHYTINRPLGAAFGESDLTAIIPWLKRYSRMLEDRVRFHWATRMFLWFVTVPHNRVQEKRTQYATPPEAGSIVVKDDAETWEAQSPIIRGQDAAPDLRATRMMIDAGSGYPPHWRGEATDVNLATAVAMQEPAERHLRRRQRYLIHILCDLTYWAYRRAHQLRPQLWPALDEQRYSRLFTVSAPDVSRADNHTLAQATRQLSQAMATMSEKYNDAPTLKRILLKLLFRFAGEPLEQEAINKIMHEATHHAQPQPTPS